MYHHLWEAGTSLLHSGEVLTSLVICSHLFMFLDRLVTCSDLQFAFPQNEGTEQMVLNFFQRYNPDYIMI